jgi:uncharacterized membrane protein (DUF485 family)
MQELKRDIVYRRISLPPSSAQITSSQRLMAHLDSTLQILQSYLSYIGLAKFQKSILAIQVMKEVNLDLP